MRVEKPTRCSIEPKNLTYEIWNFAAGDWQRRGCGPGSCGGTAKAPGRARKTPAPACAKETHHWGAFAGAAGALGGDDGPV